MPVWRLKENSGFGKEKGDWEKLAQPEPRVWGRYIYTKKMKVILGDGIEIKRVQKKKKRKKKGRG